MDSYFPVGRDQTRQHSNRNIGSFQNRSITYSEPVNFIGGGGTNSTGKRAVLPPDYQQYNTNSRFHAAH